MTKRAYIILSLIIVAMLTRFIPHWPNFTAVGAVALFSGALYRNKIMALIIPIGALFISDLFINNLVYASYQSGFTWFTEGFYWMYAGFILTVLIGQLAVNNKKPLSILAGGLGSALVFYLLTNFGVWMTGLMYSKGLGGLLTSYTMGLPFLATQALGTVFYSALLFGLAYYLVPSYRKQVQLKRVSSN